MMIIAQDLEALNDALAPHRAAGLRIGFVPTMGALHAGHLSLVNLAGSHADVVVVSIFVNPTQFAPGEDFENYPRTEDEDCSKLRDAGVDVVFMPGPEVLYPDGIESRVKAGRAAEGLETDFRPHFFDGVVNVVHRLFDAVRPDIAAFGEKDYQQLMVIREMVEMLDCPVRIIGGEVVRDAQGLALSSRNAYLSDAELEIARTLNVVLRVAARSGDLGAAEAALLANGFEKVDYIALRWGRVLGAAWLGKTRLIDNVITDIMFDHRP